jgi:hypothetical protein
MSDNSFVFRSPLSNLTSSQKSAILTDILHTSIKNLELAQIRALAHEEFIQARAFKEKEMVIRQTPYGISSRVIRVCMYYETAINLACSIVDIFWDLLAKLDPRLKNAKSIVFKNKDSNFSEKEISSELKLFMDDNRILLQDLWHHRDNLLFEISAMIDSVDTIDLNMALSQVFSVTFHAEQKIVGICAFVQSFLKFADRYLSNRLTSSNSFTGLVSPAGMS